MTKLPGVAILALGFLAACSMPTPDDATRDTSALYTPPEASGLVGVRPYPGPRDVCQVIGENDLTIDYLDHTELLIGCPAHEIGAIDDRVSEGGVLQTQVGEWMLLSIPQG
ncbi:MAG: hypothetical protein KJO78_03290 [Alphaproteobacteria bacterium]|nr:hypothetical protein [Alphaproteobacteria bacterium]